MALAYLEVVRVVGGSNLNRTRTVFGIDVIIGNDRDFPIYQR